MCGGGVFVCVDQYACVYVWCVRGVCGDQTCTCVCGGGGVSVWCVCVVVLVMVCGSVRVRACVWCCWCLCVCLCAGQERTSSCVTIVYLQFRDFYIRGKLTHHQMMCVLQRVLSVFTFRSRSPSAAVRLVVCTPWHCIANLFVHQCQHSHWTRNTEPLESA